MNEQNNYWSMMSGSAGGGGQSPVSQAYGNIGQAAQQMPGAQMSMSTQAANMNQYAGIDYPTMSQSGASPSPNQNAAYAAPTQQAQPDSSSRGFNPWSLQGEANSR